MPEIIKRYNEFHQNHLKIKINPIKTEQQMMIAGC